MIETRAARPPLAATMTALVWFLAAALAFAPAPPAAAQDGRAVRDTVAATLAQRQRTQTVREGWEKERTDLTARYRAAQADLDALAPRVAERAGAVGATRDRVDELKRRLLESDRLGASLQDTLLALVDRLDAAVAVDLPFLPDERAQRLSLLREELAKPAVEPGREAAPRPRGVDGRGVVRLVGGGRPRQRRGGRREPLRRRPAPRDGWPCSGAPPTADAAAGSIPRRGPGPSCPAATSG